MQQQYEAALQVVPGRQPHFPSRARLPTRCSRAAYCQYELKAFQQRADDAEQGRQDLPGDPRPRRRRAAQHREAERRGAVSRLKVTETFVSIQGEADAVGWPTLFIRLTGCPLRCVYCDTAVRLLRRRVADARCTARGRARSGVRHVCVTGGEPLAQKACLELLTALCDAGFEVSLETSGALDVAAVDPRVSRVVDLKTPGSGEATPQPAREPRRARRARPAQVRALFARGLRVGERVAARARRRPCRAQVLFSPVWGQLEPRRARRMDPRGPARVRLQMQLHKILWGDEPGG